MKKLFDKDKILSAFLSYSFLFFIIVLLINGIFYKYNDFFIWSDLGINNYLNNIIIFRNVIISFWETGDLSFFTWNIGLGTNMLLELIPNVGDVFSYFSVLVSQSDLASFYKIIAFIRLFLVGISFIIYAKYKKISNHSSVVGSLIYTFSTFSLYFLVNDIYLLNLMILFPLLMIGIEKIVLENKKVLFVVISFLINFTNIYFIPVIFIFILLYSGVLIIDKYKEYGVKLILMAFFRVIFSYFLSLMLLGFILMPVFSQLLKININLLKDITSSYYKDLFMIYLVEDYSNIFIGINGIFLLYFPLCIKKFKDNRINLFLLSILYLVFIFLSIFRFSNYLGFILLLVYSLLISKTMDLYNNISKCDFKWIITFIFIELILILIVGGNSINLIICLITLFGLLLVLLNKKELSSLFNIFNLAFDLILIISIVLTINNYYQLDDNNRKSVSSYYLDNGGEIIDFENAIKFLKSDEDFYRINKDSDKLHNASIYYNFNSINGKKLFMDNRIKILNDDLDNFIDLDNSLGNFNNRTMINTLLGTKYYIANNNHYVSDGYSIDSTVGDSIIFKNNYYVGFGSFYNKYISEEEYNNLNSLEKENSLVKYVVLKEMDVNDKYVSRDNDYKENIDKTINKVSFDTNINLDDKEIIISSDEEKRIILTINDNDLHGELYLRITNLESSNCGNILIKHRDIEYSKDITNKEDLLINLSAYGKINGDIEIYLSELGKYYFDEIELLVVNFENYKEDVDKLNSSNFELLDYSSNYVRANVKYEKAGVLQLATFYDNNFKVFVDGKEANTLVVNKYFLGIYLDRGDHTIEVRYVMTKSNLGIFISSLGLIIFSIILILEIKNNFYKRKLK